jgi:putative transposase
MIDICQVKYLNNIIEQDHRFIKKITKMIPRITIDLQMAGKTLQEISRME